MDERTVMTLFLQINLWKYLFSKFDKRKKIVNRPIMAYRSNIVLFNNSKLIVNRFNIIYLT